MSSTNEVTQDISMSSRMTDSSTEFTVHFNTPLAPSTYRTGQAIELQIVDPTLQDGFAVVKGVVEKVMRDDTNNNRIYEIYGRNIGRLLMKQPFKYDCTDAANSKSRTVYQLLQLILQDTGITIGRGVSALKSVTLNTKTGDANRFCGSWSTKRDAINALFSQYIKLAGMNKIRWFVDLSGYFQWFQTSTDRFDYNYIFSDDDRKTSFLVTEDATNIMNDLIGYAGENNTITVHLTNEESIHGEGTLENPGYGPCIGEPISEPDMTQAQLTAKVQAEINQKSVPVYTATLVLKGFYVYEPGTQIQFPNDPYYSGMNFTITDRTYSGNPQEGYTSTFNLSTDESVVSVPNEFDSINAAAVTAAHQVKSQTGTAQADASGGHVLIYVNETGTVEDIRTVN